MLLAALLQLKGRKVRAMHTCDVQSAGMQALAM
jgi:hypothetical protein